MKSDFAPCSQLEVSSQVFSSFQTTRGGVGGWGRSIYADMGTHSMQCHMHFEMTFSVKDLKFLDLSDSAFILILSVLN